MKNLQPETTRSPLRVVIQVLIRLSLGGAVQATAAGASVLITTDPVQIAAFQSGRTVLGFDEIVVPPDPAPCFVLLDPNEHAALGIVISAQADGSDQTHVARLPGCGHFGSTHSPPNVIGGGTSPNTGWRETVRFDFPDLADAIGAHTDASGSNTTLTAYRSDGSVIASASGDEGTFLGIAEPNISYARWEWNFDQSIPGFSLDNVTFSRTPPVPALGRHSTALLASLLIASAFRRLTSG